MERTSLEVLGCATIKSNILINAVLKLSYRQSCAHSRVEPDQKAQSSKIVFICFDMATEQHMTRAFRK